MQIGAFRDGALRDGHDNISHRVRDRVAGGLRWNGGADVGAVDRKERTTGDGTASAAGGIDDSTGTDGGGSRRNRRRGRALEHSECLSHHANRAYATAGSWVGVPVVVQQLRSVTGVGCDMDPRIIRNGDPIATGSGGQQECTAST